jgi:gluconokinase
VEATEDHRSLTAIRPNGRFHRAWRTRTECWISFQHYHYRVGEGIGPPIVVMGVSGSGKSTIGAALAQRLRVPFADADDFHPPANVAKMTAGHALDDNDRVPWLEAIGEWLASHGDGGVMSCSALKRTYRDQLRNHCATVEFLHLTSTFHVLAVDAGL